MLKINPKEVKPPQGPEDAYAIPSPGRQFSPPHGGGPGDGADVCAGPPGMDAAHLIGGKVFAELPARSAGSARALEAALLLWRKQEAQCMAWRVFVGWSSLLLTSRQQPPTSVASPATSPIADGSLQRCRQPATVAPPNGSRTPAVEAVRPSPFTPKCGPDCGYRDRVRQAEELAAAAVVKAEAADLAARRSEEALSRLMKQLQLVAQAEEEEEDLPHDLRSHRSVTTSASRVASMAPTSIPTSPAATVPRPCIARPISPFGAQTASIRRPSSISTAPTPAMVRVKHSIPSGVATSVSAASGPPQQARSQSPPGSLRAPSPPVAASYMMAPPLDGSQQRTVAPWNMVDQSLPNQRSARVPRRTASPVSIGVGRRPDGTISVAAMPPYSGVCAEAPQGTLTADNCGFRQVARASPFQNSRGPMPQSRGFVHMVGPNGGVGGPPGTNATVVNAAAANAGSSGCSSAMHPPRLGQAGASSTTWSASQPTTPMLHHRVVEVRRASPSHSPPPLHRLSPSSPSLVRVLAASHSGAAMAAPPNAKAMAIGTPVAGGGTWSAPYRGLGG
eukprot:CAMPEP_0206572350 /NCGR_PEP_ID=MMETSP0325_2-20121206/28196_1 /ASSEMBLY_ACC=CAM_ASM_000347 /TAXON_ID=2866 /ORGANISM="Crypthecodinium cohnii, Strain Seligo" /LENGTH=561 /DNA_ID=CAMNT_0054076543 /DNA_START=63 /DNA_END=1748 /DNA_ORIENTATION=+